MGISHTLSRCFFWADNILWKEDVEGHHTTVVLAEKDLIVNTKEVASYLTGTNDWITKLRKSDQAVWESEALDVVWFQELDHAHVFESETTRKVLVDIIHKYSGQSTE